MTDISSNNKRIAKNTIILYARTLFVLVLKLYTSRLILQYLGVTDYGIYNVVGSFIAMFTIFNGALTTSIQRYLTFSLGKRNYEEVRNVFSISMVILLCLCLVIIMFAESFGLWYVNSIMEVPEDRIFATNIVYQFSIFTFVLSVLTVPYNSILTAFENFKIFAYFDILNAVLAFLIVLSLPKVSFDLLIYYSGGLFLLSVLTRVLYGLYCHRKYEASHFRIVKDRTLCRNLFSFSFYSFFGNLGIVIGEGGINLVINLFFGVTLNATRGISTQVSNALGGFIRSFTMALNPQITKTYADNDIERCTNLVFYSAKYSFLIYLIFIIPVFVNVEYILSLWLTVIPPFTEMFIRLMLIQSLIHIIFNPITTVVNASGKIKAYQSGTFAILISNIFFIYIVYKLGYPAYAGLIVQCIVTFLQLVFSMIVMQKTTGINAKLFFIRSVIPSISVFFICLICSFAGRKLLQNAQFSPIVSVGSSLIITIATILYIGFNSSQRKKIVKSIIKTRK